MTPIHLSPDFNDWRALDAMLRAAYAPMLGRINPPSFLDTMTTADIADKATREDLFLALDGTAPIACGFGVLSDGIYEIGKIAVAPTHQRRGLCRAMIDAAAKRARDLGAQALQLYVRVELLENQATYAALGFHHYAAFTHPGFAHPTALILRRAT